MPPPGRKTISLNNHELWAEHKLRDIDEILEMAMHCEVIQDPRGRHQEGWWFYGDEDAKVIYSGYFSAHQPAGSPDHTTGTLFFTAREFRESLEQWIETPVYASTEDDDGP